MRLFNTLTIIGAGLIGSSLARAVKQLGLAAHVVVADTNQAHCDIAMQLGFADEATDDLPAAVAGADMVVLATPVGTFADIMGTIAPHLPADCIITDVGSVKRGVIDVVEPMLPADRWFVPGHPVAGTEHSGPAAGFAEMFQNQWCILTPTRNTPLHALDAVQKMWEAVGASVVIVDADHHDDLFALTSHLPSLLAFALVNTAADLGEHTQTEVLRFAASGFRGATRLAAQDPAVWRDIFLANREALLTQLNLLQEEIAAMARAIRWGDTQVIEDKLTRARAIRQTLKTTAA
jgi:cyclohexadieny/prephenate dehydrogenase